ncbi:class II fructose-bisphosphate aldolase [Alistipes timonensis]
MLVSLKEVLRDAYDKGYAVGAFNCLSLENVLGAVEAAETLRSPIILQLAEVQFPCAPMELMAPLYLQAARNASVPVVVHLDHGQSLETCVKAIRCGFNSVMFDGAALSLARNIDQTRQVVRIARASGVDVEAELGRVGNTGSGSDEGAGSESEPDVYTDVEDSVLFVDRTGVDALAIAIGNRHGHYTATPRLNIARLQQISRRNALPLVLHGGSGTSREDFKSCIHNGISKINVATAMQMAVAERLRHYIETTEYPDYIAVKREIMIASRDCVLEHIELFESSSRA